MKVRGFTSVSRLLLVCRGDPCTCPLVAQQTGSSVTPANLHFFPSILNTYSGVQRCNYLTVPYKSYKTGQPIFRSGNIRLLLN